MGIITRMVSLEQWMEALEYLLKREPEGEKRDQMIEEYNAVNDWMRYLEEWEPKLRKLQAQRRREHREALKRERDEARKRFAGEVADFLERKAAA